MDAWSVRKIVTTWFHFFATGDMKNSNATICILKDIISILVCNHIRIYTVHKIVNLEFYELHVCAISSINSLPISNIFVIRDNEWTRERLETNETTINYERGSKNWREEKRSKRSRTGLIICLEVIRIENGVEMLAHIMYWCAIYIPLSPLLCRTVMSGLYAVFKKLFLR